MSLRMWFDNTPATEKSGLTYRTVNLGCLLYNDMHKIASFATKSGRTPEKGENLYQKCADWLAFLLFCVMVYVERVRTNCA
jgi:hypothetical protein